MNLLRWFVSSFPQDVNAFLVCLLLLSINLEGICCNQCMPGLPALGWTSPAGDIILKEGDTLNITCHLDPDKAKANNYSSNDIFFSQVQKRIQPQYVTRLNETAARLVLRNVSCMNDWFYCKLATKNPISNEVALRNSLNASGSNNFFSTTNETVVCANIVAVGKEPKEITNFSCVSYNWKELKCTWTLPNNTVKTTYSISYMTPKRGGRSMKYGCPNETGDSTTKTCVWTDNTTPQYRRTFEFLNIVFAGNNTFGVNEQTHRFHHYAHIIPQPPRNLTAVEKTTNSIYLGWNIDDLHLFDKGWVYNVSYTHKPTEGWNSVLLSDKELERKQEIRYFNVTDLKYPNTAYDFRVKMRTAVAYGDQGWSELAILVVKTKPCAPYRSPRTTAGGFDLQPVHVDSEGERFVFVYWQPLLTAEYNGENFRYEFSVLEDGEHTEKEPLTINYSFAEFKISSREHEFLIYSTNKEGRAKNPSVVRVPSREHTIKAPTILSKIDYGNGLYELSWKGSEASQITNYTVFWCESKKEYPIQCEGYIDWSHVPYVMSKYNFTVNPTKVYQFAVSANSEIGVSGMVWASCTVLHDRVNKIKSVWVDKADSYYIIIRWKLECSDKIDALRGYYIYYCPIESPKSENCSSPIKNITIYGDLDTDHGNITELEPFKYYRVSMAMFTSNITGPKSDYLVNRTLDGKPDMSSVKFRNATATSNSIWLEWIRPNMTNGELKSYVITYSDNVAAYLKRETNDTRILLPNLVSYKTYHIKLQACTIVCSDPFGPISVTTNIGKPGRVLIKNSQNVNASHVVITWDRPDVPGGPNPTYRVRIKYHGDPKKRGKEVETQENSTLVDFTSCTSGTFTVQVRAENKDERTGRIYEGDWSHEIYNNCSDGTFMHPLMKILLIAASAIVICVFVYFSSKLVREKWRDMKSVEVTLPAKFMVPPLFTTDANKEREFYEDFRVPQSKSMEEFYNLVDKNTELVSLKTPYVIVDQMGEKELRLC